MAWPYGYGHLTRFYEYFIKWDLINSYSINQINITESVEIYHWFLIFSPFTIVYKLFPEIDSADAHSSNDIAWIPTSVGGTSLFLIRMTRSVHSDASPGLFSKFWTEVIGGDSSDFNMKMSNVYFFSLLHFVRFPPFICKGMNVCSSVCSHSFPLIQECSYSPFQLKTDYNWGWT